ncbi:MAG: heparan-alpha-glucosaminide N-acetyltransferase [Ruminococcus sp.]|nr:heparan-alpha-glucosaminide N-acetyltransferase [Ruminococcus sp.]
MEKKRISIIDEARGLCIIFVVIYHLFYSLAMIFNVESIYESFRIMRIFQPILPTVFIFISGISFQLSRSNIKRGFMLLIISAMMTAVLLIFMPSQVIWFGILHFLAISHIICGLLKKPIDKIPAIAGLIVCVILFFLTCNIQRGYLGFEGLWAVDLPSTLYQTYFTVPLGFCPPGFYSADFFPILPWIFLFIAGTIVGRYVQNLPDSLIKPHIKPLAFIGRHTLIIYLAHQPIIVGIGYLIMGIKK